MLARTRKTSPVNDKISYWVYRDCSNELAEDVANIVNMSVGDGIVPVAWRTAVITPVAKCTQIISVADLRPISVTPILSRMVDRLIVKEHIYPVIPPKAIYDQYGFKPTGSTTAAIVDITHTVSIVLETNKFVRCLMIDFSKAFDSVDHLSLIQKLKSLNIADNIIQWVVSLLTDLNQYVQLNGNFHLHV